MASLQGLFKLQCLQVAVGPREHHDKLGYRKVGGIQKGNSVAVVAVKANAAPAVEFQSRESDLDAKFGDDLIGPVHMNCIPGLIGCRLVLRIRLLLSDRIIERVLQ